MWGFWETEMQEGFAPERGKWMSWSSMRLRGKPENKQVQISVRGNNKVWRLLPAFKASSGLLLIWERLENYRSIVSYSSGIESHAVRKKVIVAVDKCFDKCYLGKDEEVVILVDGIGNWLVLMLKGDSFISKEEK